MPNDNIVYVTNPSKVPKKYAKYLHKVEVDERYRNLSHTYGNPPKSVFYHPHHPTFIRILNELNKAGVNTRPPLYGYMFAGVFYAMPGTVMGNW